MRSSQWRCDHGGGLGWGHPWPDEAPYPHACDGCCRQPLHPDPELIALAGDWHGNLPWASQMIAHARDNGATVIVHLGDFGFWSDGPDTRKYLSRITRLLEQLDMMLIFVDGNHEDHDRLDKLPIDPETGLREITDRRIWHLPRGFRWTWHGKGWMALGGAHSVDRNWRVEGESWWPRESLSDAEIAHAKRAGRVDVMVCHDCPDGVDIPAIRGPSEWPEYDLARSLAHRQLLGEVVAVVQPSVLYHGHYHCRYDGVLHHEDGGNTVVHGLDCDGSTPQDNMLILDLTSGAKAERSDKIAWTLRAAQAYGQQRLDEAGIDVDDIPRLAKESRSS